MKNQLKVFFWALKYSFIISPLRFLFNLLIVIVSSLSPVILAVYSGIIIEHVIQLIASDRNGMLIFREVVILGILFVLNKFLFYGSGIITSALDIKINTKIKEKLVNIIRNVSLKEFDNMEFNNDLNLAKDGFDSLLIVADNFYYFVGELSAIVSTLIVIANIFPIALIFICISFIVGYYLNMRSKKIQRNFWEETVNERRYSDYLIRIMTNRENAKEIRSFKLQSLFMPIWTEIRDRLRNKSIEINKESSAKFAQYQIFMDLINILVLVMAIISAHYGNMQIEDIIILWQLNAVALVGVQTINSAYSEIYYNNSKLEKAQSFIQKFSFQKTDKCHTKKNEKNVFTAENVCFAYKKGEEILKNISLCIPKNQSVAIIGENGSGKSTLIKILMGLYKPDSGNVFIDGINTREIDNDYIQQNIGAVFQDFICYPFSLRENIGYGCIDKIENDQSIIEAAVKGDIKYIIDKAETLSKPMGKTLAKHGLEISGGEWQRIALSRAYMGDKPIMVFDEPASKLDPKAELKQFEEIKNMLTEKTAILVSHRIGFARLAQRIIVMKSGKIVEDGTHEELIAKNGEYYKLLSEQAKWYDLDRERE